MKLAQLACIILWEFGRQKILTAAIELRNLSPILVIIGKKKNNIWSGFQEYGLRFRTLNTLHAGSNKESPTELRETNRLQQR